MAVQYYHSYFCKHLGYGMHLAKQEHVLVLRAVFMMTQMSITC